MDCLYKKGVSTPLAFLKSAFVALLDKSNLTFTLASKDFVFGILFTHLYYVFFLSIQLLNELLYPFHLTYNLSPFILIAFSILNSFKFVFCIYFS